MTHSLSEADLVFSPAEREVAAARLAPRLKNARQRFRRNMARADEALASFDRRTGTLHDLVERERYAERAQLNIMEAHAVENLIRGLVA